MVYSAYYSRYKNIYILYKKQNAICKIGGFYDIS